MRHYDLVSPPLAENNRMVAASLSHPRISVACSMLAACSTSRGGGGGFRKSKDRSPRHPVREFGAVRSQAAALALHGRSEPAPLIVLCRGRVCGAHPFSGMAAYRSVAASGERVVRHHWLHSWAQFAPTMHASQAVMELRPMIHGGKSAPRRCPENALGRSR